MIRVIFNRYDQTQISNTVIMYISAVIQVIVSVLVEKASLMVENVEKCKINCEILEKAIEDPIFDKLVDNKCFRYKVIRRS